MTTRREEEKVLRAHEQWARNIAQALFEKLGPLNGLAIDDFSQNARLGLLKAARTYEPARGPFKAHAAKIVRGAILDGLRDADEVGRFHRGRGLGRRIQSIEGPAGRDPEGKILTIGATLRGPDLEERAAALGEVDALLAGLSIGERAVFTLLALEGRSPFEVSAYLGLSESRVFQIQAKALRQLRASREVRRRVRRMCFKPLQREEAARPDARAAARQETLAFDP